MTKRKDRQLTHPYMARQFMSSIINAAHRGELPIDRLRSLSYAVQILLKCMETSELAEQMSRIESLLGGKK